MSQITNRVDAVDAPKDVPRGVAVASTSGELVPSAARALETGASASEVVTAGPYREALRVGFGPGASEEARLEGYYRGHEVYAPVGAAAPLLALALLGEEPPAALEEVPARCRAALHVAGVAIASAPRRSVDEHLAEDLDGLLEALASAPTSPSGAAAGAEGVVALDAAGAVEVAAVAPALPLLALRFGMPVLGVVGSAEDSLVAVVTRLDHQSAVGGAAVIERDDERAVRVHAPDGAAAYGPVRGPSEGMTSDQS